MEHHTQLLFGILCFTCLLLAVLFFYSCCRWQETGKSRWAGIAGFSLGYGLMTRYLSMFAMALPVLIFVIYPGFKRKEIRRAGLCAFFLAAGGVTALHLYYNFLITGNLLNTPNHYFHAHERLGFIAGYTPGLALHYFEQRLLYLTEWTPPALTLIFLAGLFFFKPLHAWDKGVRSSVISLAMAYLFYYSWGGNQYGPRYYFEAYPFLSLLASSFLIRIYQAGEGRAKKMAAGMTLASLLGALPIFFYHASFFRTVSAERRSAYDLAEAMTAKPALVFLSGFLGNKLVISPEDSVRNDPFLDSPVIYAHDLGEKNKALIPYFKNRNYYRAHYDRGRNRPELEKITF